MQIDITGDEWQALDGKKWFAYATVYSSPDGTGWYSMPEVGDTVRLEIENPPRYWPKFRGGFSM